MCSSVVEYVLSMQKALGSIPRTKKKSLKFNMFIGREQKRKNTLELLRLETMNTKFLVPYLIQR